MKKSFFKGLFAGLFAGTVAGVVTGMLTAPKSGKELREDLRKNFDQLSGEVQRRASELGVSSRDMYERVVDEAMKAYEKVKNLDQKDLVSLKNALIKEWESFSKKNLSSTKKGTVPRRTESDNE